MVGKTPTCSQGEWDQVLERLQAPPLSLGLREMKIHISTETCTRTFIAASHLTTKKCGFLAPYC